MSHEPYLTSEITVGRDGNKISAYNDGSMVFSDRFNPLVRLSDLVNITSDAAKSLTIDVLLTDWTLDHIDSVYSRSFWKVTIPLTSVISDTTKAFIICNKVISAAPLVLEEVTLDNVTMSASTVTIISSEKLHLYVSIKSV
jgi:hypothetical protein